MDAAISVPIQTLYATMVDGAAGFCPMRVTHPEQYLARSTDVEPYCIGGREVTNLMAPGDGLEPPTYWLTANRSTD